ncbi:MAG: ribosomal L7Ae/L30e/S12e/Gadd45 family protein [Gemmatimonadales bacterium]|nr:ribosomal L7Ae/L30e/S12e/Gadd45 family protein [Gemmatimonadales bacterium]
MTHDPLLGLLGLGARAGHVTMGVDGTRAALQRDECRLVVLASDASPRAIEKVVRLARAKGATLLTGPVAELLGSRMGRPPMMVAGVKDRALARGILAAVRAVTGPDGG